MNLTDIDSIMETVTRKSVDEVNTANKGGMEVNSEHTSSGGEFMDNYPKVPEMLKKRGRKSGGKNGVKKKCKPRN